MNGIPTFAVTFAVFEQRLFRGGFQGSAIATTVATECIEEAARELAIMLRAVRVEPDSITVGAAESSYRWCQDFICYRAAPEFVRRVGKADAGESGAAWDAKADAMKKDLNERPHVVLGDLTQFRSTGGVAACFR